MTGRYPQPDSDWWRSEMGKRMCKRCGEDRLTHLVTDGWGQQMFCDVCSHSWVIRSNAEWQTREQMGVVIGSTTGE